MRFWCERKVGKTNSLLLYGSLAIKELGEFLASEFGFSVAIA
ncbi:hypothetical protein LINGRAHAP2_LOCUS14904 [Linum grandiflorum]